ncbi:flagellar basal-body rod protein FlgG [Paenibacillus phyllosphaerae]|uniref:Flagellar basal-body rod protein FlgG n=1 Tax=Paenibacillus phyllosphaerae TaxID=274593 RepID=A0A7W5AXE8_9BACL|nr:flagellar hook-basal body protein [Paenibacillus phyllosphaerae]MBB3110528.1 flagellar basal-body rod protein FlgG [Paenibacillus phyllosphaerae]
MLRGLYTAAAGMIAQQHRHDTVTNNIANINTPGYKQTNAVTRSFPEMMIALNEGKNKTSVGRLNTGVLAEESIAMQLQGDLMQTNRSSDFAIMSDIEVPGVAFDDSGKSVSEDGEVTYQPQAFFTVQDPSGEMRYTRGGRFSVNDQGYLVTGDGSTVLGQNGAPIQLPANASMDQYTVTSDFRLVNPVTGQQAGQLLISRVDNPNNLVRVGNGKFALEGDEAAQTLTAGERVEVRQGYLERSNVDSAQSMVDLMSAARAYEANQKVIQFYDKSLDKAVNEVGRV